MIVGMTQHLDPIDPARVTSMRIQTNVPRTDEQTLPPFMALDRLSAVTAQIDNIFSTLIGQLSPYCDDRAVSAELRQAEQVAPDAASSLERRIDREIVLLQELAARGEELLQELRL